MSRATGEKSRGERKVEKQTLQEGRKVSGGVGNRKSRRGGSRNGKRAEPGVGRPFYLETGLG